MNGGVVYAAWPGGAVAVDRDGQAASSRTPIDRRAECGCARWHALVALCRDAVGWAAASRRWEETVAVRCQTTGGFRWIVGSRRNAVSGVVWCAWTPLGTNDGVVVGFDSERLEGPVRRSGGVVVANKQHHTETGPKLLAGAPGVEAMGHLDEACEADDRG